MVKHSRQATDQPRRRWRQAPGGDGLTPRNLPPVTPAGSKGQAGPSSNQTEDKSESSAKQKTDQAVDKALDDTAKKAGATPAGEVANAAKVLKNTAKTAREEGKVAAAADLGAVGVRAGATATGAGAVAVKGWDATKKALGAVGINLKDRYVVYILAFFALLNVMVIVFVIFVAVFLWEHPFQALRLGINVIAHKLGFGINRVIDTGGASRLAWEMPVSSGAVYAANPISSFNGPVFKPGSYREKLSKIDWEKAKFQTTENLSACNVVTEEVTAPDGKKRSVIKRVTLNSDPGGDLTGTARANCINNVYPIFNTVMRSQFVRDGINKQLGVRYAYALPKDSTELNGKANYEINNYLYNKSLDRIWQHSGNGVTGYETANPNNPVITQPCKPGDNNCILSAYVFGYSAGGRITAAAVSCANNYDFNINDKTIDVAVAKAKHDLKCGIPPQNLKFMYELPSESAMQSSDPNTQVIAKAVGLKTMCEIYTRTQEDNDIAVDKYNDAVKQRIASESNAALQAFTYASTSRARFLDIRELNGDAYKIYSMGNAQEYQHDVLGEIRGKSTESDAVSRSFGIPNVRKDPISKTAIYNDAAVVQAQAVLDRLKGNTICEYLLSPGIIDSMRTAINDPATGGTVVAALNTFVTGFFDRYYPEYKRAIATVDYYSRDTNGRKISLDNAAKRVTLEDLLIKLVRIESNAATAGVEEGTQNFDRMGVGIKAYRNSLSNSLGGQFLTENQAVASENQERVFAELDDAAKGLTWRLFATENPRSITSRISVALIDKPDRIMTNVGSVFGDLFNPVKNLVGSKASLAYAFTSHSNVAQAANSYEIDSLRIDPAGIPDGFYSDIDPLTNADAIESLKENNPSAAFLMASWDECFKEYIPSRFFLINPPADKEQLYAKYCRELFDTTAPFRLNQAEKDTTQIISAYATGANYDFYGRPTNDLGRRTLSFMYRAYHFFNIQADGMLYLSNPDATDKSLNASSSANTTTDITDPNGDLSDSPIAIDPTGDTTAQTCPSGTSDAGTGDVYNDARVLLFRIRLCKIGATSTIVNVAIAGQVRDMYQAAAGDGILLAGGGYRTYASQVALRRAHCGATDYDIYEKSSSACSPPTARPGRSMHERGLAIDLTSGGATIRKGSRPYLWMATNAAKYGLKNLPSESWHWSINGN